MDSADIRTEESAENGEKRGSGNEEPKKAWGADRVAKEFIVQLGRTVKDLAGKMREDSLHEAVRATTNKVANKLESAGSYLEEGKFEDLVGDAVSTIRKYPVQSVLLGVTVGILLGRRGGK